MLKTGKNGGQARGGAFGGLQTAVGQFGQAAGTNPNAQMSGIGGMLQGAGTLAGLIPGVGALGPALGLLAKTTFESVDRLRNWNKELLQANLHFANFSPSMAAVEARAEFRQFKTGQIEGDARAPGAEKLAQAMDRLERATIGLRVTWSNFQAKVAERTATAVELLAEPDYWAAVARGAGFTELMELAKKIARRNQGQIDNDQTQSVQSWLAAVGGRSWADENGVPERLRGGGAL